VRKLAALLIVVAGCNAEFGPAPEDQDATAGVSIAPDPLLSGCAGHASSTIPSDDRYVLTSFGGGSDDQAMSCGGQADGTWYYAASRQRYGCGAHLQVEGNGKCVVVAADDYGPDTCVENAAHMPILDASPKVAEYLFGESGLGWSDGVVVTVSEVASSTPLGPCSDTTTPPPTMPTSCSSSTLGRDVDSGTCVQSASDESWYQCENGAWQAIASTSSCGAAIYAWCESATLGRAVPPRTCVQSASNSAWYQCNGQGWVKPVDAAGQTGPIGACSSMHPL
jgi:hypothetical protein